ncbi:MAG: sulfite exporter TauE/SafE family protein [Clostridiales bacterium]
MGTLLIRGLQIALVVITCVFTFVLGRDVKKNKDRISNKSFWGMGAISGFTMFFDALGVGSYGPQTSLFKIFKLVPDKLIPGTLNTISVIPCAVETFLFITIIEVDPLTLISLIVAAAVGATFGAGIVAKLPERVIQLAMGTALIIVAITIFAGLVGWMPSGGDATGLSGWKLPLAIVINLFLGACSAIGIGCYAPMMAMVYALGMSPRVAFPIMMGSYAFLMPAAGIKFIKEGAYDIKANLAGQIFGTIGVVIAVLLVKELPITVLKWIVIAVLLYTSVIMFRSAYKSKKEENDKKPDDLATA